MLRLGPMRLLLAGVIALAASVEGCGGGHHSSSSGTGTTTTGATLSSDPHYVAALNLINQSRVQYGSQPVAIDETISQCALRHAQDVAACSNFSIGGFGNCAHKDFAAGDTCTAVSENQGVATGITTATEDQGFANIHAGMMSEGPPPTGQINHFSNIIDPARTKVGLGLFIDSKGNLWISEEFR